MKKVIHIDSEGFFLGDMVLQDEESISSGCIEVSCPEGFYKPKWNGEIWIEGATLEYINSLKNQLQEPTQEERLELLERAMDEMLLGGI